MDITSMPHVWMKIRYDEMDVVLRDVFTNGPEPVNLFINYETVLETMVQRISQFSCRIDNSIGKILLGESLNLAAHYKRYFTGSNCNVKVILYMTDLRSKRFPGIQEIIPNYRETYLNKYTRSTKYSVLGNACVNQFLPAAEKVYRYIPDVYFVTAKGFEGSLIPSMVSQLFNNRKNIIITGDVVDTQYMLGKNFFVFFIRKSITGNKREVLCSSFQVARRYIYNRMKDRLSHKDMPEWLTNLVYYKILLSSIGSKIRNLEKPTGMSPRHMFEWLKSKIDIFSIPENPSSEEFVLSKYRDKGTVAKLSSNYKGMNLYTHFILLKEFDKESIISQLVDSFDYNSLLVLNRKYSDSMYIRLEDLTRQVPMETRNG